MKLEEFKKRATFLVIREKDRIFVQRLIAVAEAAKRYTDYLDETDFTLLIDNLAALEQE